MTQNQRNRLIAVVTTITVHAVVLFILGSIILKSEPVKEEFGGVFVQVGYVDEASGTFEPYMPEPADPVVTPSQPEQIPDESTEDLITQDSEETTALEEKKRREEEEARRREEQLKREAEERLLAEQREKEQRVSNAMQNAFGGATEGNRGTAEQGEGVQGSPTGNAPTGASQGVGGWGGFSLQGRKCLDLPKPRYNSNIEGTVVVEITVDKSGAVIAASVKVGSSPNESLRAAALEAAKKARFDRSDKNVTQVGTITYNFKQR